MMTSSAEDAKRLGPKPCPKGGFALGSLRAVLAESGGDHHGAADAPGHAVLERGPHFGRRQSHDGQVDGAIHIQHRRDGR